MSNSLSFFPSHSFLSHHPPPARQFTFTQTCIYWDTYNISPWHCSESPNDCRQWLWLKTGTQLRSWVSWFHRPHASVLSLLLPEVRSLFTVTSAFIPSMVASTFRLEKTDLRLVRQTLCLRHVWKILSKAGNDAREAIHRYLRLFFCSSLPDIVCVMPLTCTSKEVCFHRSILSHLSLVSDVATISGPILFVDCRLGAV